MTSRADIDLSFDDPHLRGRVEAMGPSAIDVLPFGVVQVDRTRRITLFNSVERGASGLVGGAALGRDLYAVARHLDRPAVRAPIEDAASAPSDGDPLEFDLETEGDYGDPTRRLRLRIRSASQGGSWVFVSRGSTG